jgi:hypothetical protein
MKIFLAADKTKQNALLSLGSMHTMSAELIIIPATQLRTNTYYVYF